MLKILEPYEEDFGVNDEGILAGLIIGPILLAMAMINGYYNSRPQIFQETNRGVVFQSSTDFNQGRVRAYDFDKDGLLDKVESASFSYRPAHLAWHDVKKDSPFYSGVQKEYSEFLKSGGI